METRKVTIVSTKNQVKKVIETGAETLGELKRDLGQANIDYSGMTFYEGLTRVELKDDSSLLPRDVPFRGNITNELVFMLTVPNKKLSSGAEMSRKEAYALIKAKGLQETCVCRFGKNFTMCKTSDLISLIEGSAPAESVEEAEESKAVPEKEVKPAKVNAKEVKGECSESYKLIEELTKLKGAFSYLITTLRGNGLLGSSEAFDVIKVLNGNMQLIDGMDGCGNPKGEVDAVPYDDSEIRNMFDFLN